MNPGCIKNTSEAEMIIHNMSVLFILSLPCHFLVLEIRALRATRGLIESKDKAMVDIFS
jgi:hypothetical protein